MTMSVPDVAGVIVGWRFWTTYRHLAPSWQPEQPTAPERLYSVTSAGGNTLWPSRLPMDARCLQQRDHGDRYAPGEDCKCGVYARSDEAGLLQEILYMAALPDAVFAARFVAGQVEVWGKVFEGERGWRGEHARVRSLVRLWDPEHDEAMGLLAAAYSVPVVQPDGPLAEWVEATRKRLVQRTRELEARLSAATPLHTTTAGGGGTGSWFHRYHLANPGPYFQPPDPPQPRGGA